MGTSARQVAMPLMPSTGSKSAPKAHSATGWRQPIEWTRLILGRVSIPNGGFVLESKPTIFRNFRTESWLQSRYVHSIGAGVGVSLCPAARETLSRSCPASAGNQQAPTLTRPHERGAGIESACRESSPAPSMGAGRGGGEPLPSRARNPVSIVPCFCRKSAGRPRRHRSLN